MLIDIQLIASMFFLLRLLLLLIIDKLSVPRLKTGSTFLTGATSLWCCRVASTTWDTPTILELLLLQLLLLTCSNFKIGGSLAVKVGSTVRLLLFIHHEGWVSIVSCWRLVISFNHISLYALRLLVVLRHTPCRCCIVLLSCRIIRSCIPIYITTHLGRCTPCSILSSMLAWSANIYRCLLLASVDRASISDLTSIVMNSTGWRFNTATVATWALEGSKHVVTIGLAVIIAVMVSLLYLVLRIEEVEDHGLDCLLLLRVSHLFELGTHFGTTCISCRCCIRGHMASPTELSLSVLISLIRSTNYYRLWTVSL